MIIAGIFGHHRVTLYLHVIYLSVGNVFKIIINHCKSIGGQRINQFKFCALNIFYRFKRFKMLCSYSSYDSHLRVNDIAYFFNISNVLRPHFHNEYVIVGLKHFSHSTYHSHRCVVATRSHQHRVFLR